MRETAAEVPSLVEEQGEVAREGGRKNGITIGMLKTRAIIMEEVRRHLEERHASVESVRVVRDRKTGGSRGFAFVKFISIEHAKMWIEANSPCIFIDELRVKVDYSNNVPYDDDDWPCKKCGSINFKRRATCFQCKGAREALESLEQLSANVNNGSRDVGTQPTSVLLVLFESMQSYGAVKEVRLVKERATSMSLGFGFVEFADLPTATHVLSLAYAPTPTKFEVDGRAISLAYSNPASFVPVYAPSSWVSTSSVDASGATVYLQYWDELAYAPVYPPMEETVRSSQVASRGTGQHYVAAATVSKPPQAKSMDDELAAFYADATIASQPPKMKTIDDALAAFYDDITSDGGSASAAAADTIQPQTTVPARADLKRPIQAVNSKIAKQMEKWQDRLQESNGMEEDVGEDEQEPIDLSEESLKKRLPPEAEINQKHSDLNLKACMLCERQFKSVEDLSKHQLKSNLHKTNMKTHLDNLLGEIRTKLMAEEANRRQYRNRAAERRKMYGQPKRIKLQHPYAQTTPAPAPPSKKRSGYTQYGIQRAQAVLESSQPNGGSPVVVPQVAPSAGLGAENKGSKLLKALGWKEGQGLGAKNDGIVNPIEAKGYVKGAGVGSLSAESSFADAMAKFLNQ
ncbi:hypothetical protein HDU67_000294 [Dinochytrium kinnereticum]|nr:hypothetical protein HDU67_000294 [Dinochytrium kinnereticum]